MNKKKVAQIKKYLEEQLEEKFHEVFHDDGSVGLLSRDVILDGLQDERVILVLKSDLYPDDAALIAITIKQMVDKFKYKDVVVNEVFNFSENDMIFGEDAKEQMKEDLFNHAKSHVEHAYYLDYMVKNTEGFEC